MLYILLSYDKWTNMHSVCFQLELQNSSARAFLTPWPVFIVHETL